MADRSPDGPLTLDDVHGAHVEWPSGPAKIIIDLFRRQFPDIASDYQDDERLFDSLRWLIETGYIAMQCRGSFDDDDFQMRFTIIFDDDEAKIRAKTIRDRADEIRRASN